MKKTIVFLITFMMIISVALADLPDISALSFDELVELRSKLNLAIWESSEWQEVTVPVGVWEVGKDIPVGHWNITAAKGNAYPWGTVTYCSELDASGKNAGNMWDMDIYYSQQVKYAESDASVAADLIDIDLIEGTYIIIEYDAMVFTPFTGKPDLGFK